MTDIRQLIREMIQDELEEVSTSAATPGYQTPNAFRGNSKAGKAKMRKNAVNSGYTFANREVNDEDADKLTEAKLRYHDYKKDPALPRQKIGRALAEVVRNLQEIDRIVKMSARLKTETNTESGQLWKRTNQALSKIDGTLQQILHKIREIRS